MKTELRFVGEIFVPPLLGALYLIGWCHYVDSAIPDAPASARELPQLFETLTLLFLAPVVLAIVYAITMEVAFDLGVNPHSWRAVLLSQLLGGLIGVFFDLVVLRGDKLYNQGLALEMVGMMTGLTMGLCTKVFLSTPERQRIVVRAN